ncbi:MAG: hypothetical protein ACJAUC_004706 [Planctomycetota bacterium]
MAAPLVMKPLKCTLQPCELMPITGNGRPGSTRAVPKNVIAIGEIGDRPVVVRSQLVPSTGLLLSRGRLPEVMELRLNQRQGYLEYRGTRPGSRPGNTRLVWHVPARADRQMAAFFSSYRTHYYCEDNQTAGDRRSPARLAAMELAVDAVAMQTEDRSRKRMQINTLSSNDERERLAEVAASCLTRLHR